jgi:hypothetical protein
MNVGGSSTQTFEAPAQKADPPPQTRSKSSLTFLDAFGKFCFYMSFIFSFSFIQSFVFVQNQSQNQISFEVPMQKKDYYKCSYKSNHSRTKLLK